MGKISCLKTARAHKLSVGVFGNYFMSYPQDGDLRLHLLVNLFICQNFNVDNTQICVLFNWAFQN